MYPFSLFAKASNGQPMTPWERSQYKLWQVLGTALVAFLLTNLSTIQALLSGTGTHVWADLRTQLLVPLVMALILAFIKYQGAQTDAPPAPGQPLKITTFSQLASAANAGQSNEVKVPVDGGAGMVQNAPANASTAGAL